jgi:hypothetical protein
MTNENTGVKRQQVIDNSVRLRRWIEFYIALAFEAGKDRDWAHGAAWVECNRQSLDFDRSVFNSVFRPRWSKWAVEMTTESERSEAAQKAFRERPMETLPGTAPPSGDVTNTNKNTSTNTSGLAKGREARPAAPADDEAEMRGLMRLYRAGELDVPAYRIPSIDPKRLPATATVLRAVSQLLLDQARLQLAHDDGRPLMVAASWLVEWNVAASKRHASRSREALVRHRQISYVGAMSNGAYLYEPYGVTMQWLLEQAYEGALPLADAAVPGLDSEKRPLIVEGRFGVTDAQVDAESEPIPTLLD